MTIRSLPALEYDLFADDESRPSEDMVREIVQLFLTPTYFSRAVILRSPFLRNRALLHLLGDHPFRVVTGGAVIDVADWVRGCHSQGHLSVWFLPKESSRLEAEIEKKFRLGQSREVILGGPDLNGPLGAGQQDSLESLLDSGELRGSDAAFSLSHDGERIFRVAISVP